MKKLYVITRNSKPVLMSYNGIFAIECYTKKKEAYYNCGIKEQVLEYVPLKRKGGKNGSNVRS